MVDTNVLLVASAGDEGSRFEDTHVPEAEREVVFEWLAEFRKDEERLMVLDEERGIVEEYLNKLSPQDFGWQVLMQKQGSARWVLVDYDHEGFAVVPEGLSKLDKSDRKMAAAVLADRTLHGAESSIVNACDSDWYEHEKALQAHDVVVEQLLPEWSWQRYGEKHPEAKTKTPRWVAPEKKR